MDRNTVVTAGTVSSPETSSNSSSSDDNNNNNKKDKVEVNGADDDGSVAASLYSSHANLNGDSSNRSGGDDQLSVTTGTTGTGSTAAAGAGDKASSTSGWKAICCSRWFILGLVVVIAAVAGTTTYFLLKNQNQQAQKEEIESIAQQVITTAQSNVLEEKRILMTMSTSMTAMAPSSDAWPFYTQPGINQTGGVFGQSYLDDSGATMLSWSPVVTSDAERFEWGLYSTTHYPEWAGPFEDDISSRIEPRIFERTTNGRAVAAEGDGPFLPVWQTIPIAQPQVSNTVNLNLLSDEAFARNYQKLVEAAASEQQNDLASNTDFSKSQVLTEISDESTIFGSAITDTGVGPTSMVLTPILSDAQDLTSATVVGVLVAVVPWTVFLRDTLHSQNVTVVIDSERCSDGMQESFTFSVVGDEAVFVGLGDRHVEEYEEDAVMATFDSCHTITVYPTAGTLSSTEGNDNAMAVIWLVVVIVIIMLCALVFFLYDYSARRKHRETQERAAKTTAIISSLYPAEIRDRMLGRKSKKESKSALSDKAASAAVESSKYRLKSFLKEEDNYQDSNDGSDSGDVKTSKVTDVENMDEQQREVLKDADMYDTKPIAELFPNTTVMFADIAGFTAWSSVREPSQVFTLLETVYAAFDAIAKRRRIFKVETVGDCYVAVSGLPEPRSDHAIAMARFSKECVDKFSELSKKLEVTLGPDTGDLAIRAGIHSGPVTAGVLRGDKSRFQLFGDTVNTAARVESTGMRHRVHMSSVTAELLVAQGKEHWVKKRADIVSAKGKGEMQTYWLVKPGESDNFEAEDNKAAARAALASQEPTNYDATAKAVADVSTLEEIEASLPPKIQRLVGWNVEILKKQLQAIVAKRNAVNSKRNFDAQVSRLEANLNKHKQLLGEVTEVISLPKFDAKAHKNQEPASKVVISDTVLKELRLFVSIIAATHRDVPFHSFEHASHVTMSVTKLLSRIVAPADILDQEGDDDIHAALHDHTFGITSDPLTQFSVILSALIHDVDHYGVSNMQLVKEEHSLAKFFHGKSVAEQNSVVKAWEKLMSPAFVNLRKCIYSTPTELSRFRQIVVNNVLATDIFDKELNALRKSRWDKAFASTSTGGDGSGGPAKTLSLNLGNQSSSAENNVNRKATVVMERLLQASDVSHTMQHWHIYQKWNERLFAEMTLAYQHGRLGFNPADGWYDGELGFLDNYVIPMARNLKDCGVFGVSSDEYLNYVEENRREWKRKGREVVEKYVAKYCQKPNNDDDVAAANDGPAAGGAVADKDNNEA